MRVTMFLLIVLAVCLGQTPAFSAPVDIPSYLKNPDRKEMQPYFNVKGDYVDERKIEGNENSAIRGQFYTVQLGIPVTSTGDLYGEFGTLVGGRFKATSGGSTTKLKLEDGETLVAGAGINWALLRAADFHDFTVFADVKYRQIFNSDYSKAKVGGEEFKDITSNDDPEWQEWQGAIGVAGRLADGLVPYAGVDYSDVRIKSDTVVNGNSLVIDDESSKKTVGGFAGLVIAPKNSNVSLDLQARFINEQAYTGAITWKF